MRTIFQAILIILALVLVAFFLFFFIGESEPAPKIEWGVNFSKMHSEQLGLNWKKNYEAILNDLGAKHMKIVAYWDLIEKEKDNYDFEDLDWQVKKANEYDAKLLLVMGKRVPRWPECHIPSWAEDLPKEEQQEEILELIGKIVNRYKNEKSIWAWQVENEPFFPFGDCPPPDEEFLRKEVNTVKELDNEHPVVVTESGEFPLWIKAARFGDIVGTTLYRIVWVEELGIYFEYPFPPVFYDRKAKLIDRLFNKKVINVELQAEPWGSKLMYDVPLEEQKKSMNLSQFKENVEFARKTGFDKIYLWGAEWWYWLKEKKGEPQIWNEAKKLFMF